MKKDDFIDITPMWVCGLKHKEIAEIVSRSESQGLVFNGGCSLYG